MKHIVFAAIAVPLLLFFVWLSIRLANPSRRLAKLATFDVPFVAARKRLITAMMGDYKAADRLILFEQSKFSCSWLEASQRAYESLQRDRSRS